MKNTSSNGESVTLRWRQILGRLPKWVTLRTVLVALTLLAIAAGIGLNWDTLIVLGIAPWILGFLPCLTMCLLGLCSKELGIGEHASDVASSSADSASRRGEPGRR